jgi:LmbE family N-acetylglucosaminyl deacetylase
MRSFSKLWPAALAGVAMAAPAQQPVEVKDPANLTGEHVAPQSPADTLPINHGAAALQQLLLKLRTRASMMLIVAHPDDEDSGLLTYESRGQGVRVAMMTLTRGEGGQNLMSADFNDALGLIRTQELLAEDRYTGVDQMFGTEVDFGFSKTKEEAFEQWTHERVLYDAVRAVRLYRPLVLASVFVGGPTDGHGHHQVAGEICQEVFKAAADPNVFPEMIEEGLLPWAPLKVYARVPFSRVTADGMFDYATGKTIPTRFQNYVTGVVTNKVPEATVTIHEGDPAMVMGKPALGMDGMTWVQFARQGLSLQKTQVGPGVRVPPPGRSDTGYTLMGSRVENPPAKEDSLFEGIETSLPSIAKLAPDAPPAFGAVLQVIDRKLAEAQAAFDPANLEATAEPLRLALQTLDTVIEGTERSSLPATQKFNVLHELRIKRVQMNRALVLALHVELGGSLAAGVAPSEGLTPGEAFSVQSSVQLAPTLKIKRIELRLTEDKGEQSLATSTEATAHLWHQQLSSSATPTKPYYHQPNAEDASYVVDDQALRNAPQTPAPLNLVLSMDYGGTELKLMHTVTVAPPQAGAVSQPAVIVPAYSIAVSPRIRVLPKTDNSFHLAENVTPSMANAHVNVQVPAGWHVRPDGSANPAGETTWMSDRIDLDQPASKVVTIPVSVSAPDGRTYAESYRPVGYPGITSTNLYTPAICRLVPVDVTTAPNLRVAYLPGTGDDVPDFLPNLDVKPTLLTPTDLTAGNLKQYDAVILGVRAYAAQSALAGKGSQPLLDYARAGGVVIVQYMTAKYGDAEAPYPIGVPGDSAHNVVVEADPVTLLAPDAPLLTWPNKITPADFDHWVEERGHGFAATWAPEYRPLLEMHDPDQDPQKGGLLVAPVGKGAYLYCALALYRQLPEGVPGAYRLFANLLSYAKNPHRTER